MVTACRALLAAGFAERVELETVDSTLRTVPPPSAPVRAWYALSRIARVVAAVELRRPDAIILFAAVGLSFVEKACCAYYAERRGVRALLFPRGGSLMDECRASPRRRRFAAAVGRRCTRVVCQGRTMQRFFEEELGVSPARTRVIENWTADARALAEGEARLALGPAAPGAPVRLLFAGWVQWDKGVHELVEAFASVASRPDVPPMTLTIAGDGGAREAVTALVAERGVGDRVRFLGWVEGEAKRAAFRDADVFVLPSHNEGLPNAMVEAMAAGLAVVVTAVGNIPDVVADGLHARLVPPRDRVALEGAIVTLARDAAERARLARAGHALARTRFGSEAAVARIVAEIEAAVRHGSSSTPKVVAAGRPA